MKKKIIILLLISMTITGIIILYNQTRKINIKNNNLLLELEEKGLIVEGEISLEKIKTEKKELEEYTETTFKEENVKVTYNKHKETNEILTSEVSDLQNQIQSLETTINNLKAEYDRLLEEYEKPSTFFITNVPQINQYPDYPTGCESVALTILLNYYGISVTPDKIIEVLPKGARPYSKNGVLYGTNPEVEFVGTPYSSHSFGVYEKPIAKVANQFKAGINIATGTEFEDILKIVSTNTPVLVWTSINLIEPYISMSWIYELTGERIYWKANEHAVVLIGYTADKVIISDPIGGKIKYQTLSTFKERYNYYGKKALYY